MLPKVARIALLEFLLSDPSLNAKFRLVANNVAVLDKDVTLADITEATFAGYAGLTGVVFPTPIIDFAEHGETTSPTLTWTASGAGLPETIYAMYITVTISATDVLLWFHRFGTPTLLMNPADQVQKKANMLSDDSNVPAFG